VAIEHPLQCGAYSRHRPIVERCSLIAGRVAGSEQERVALSEGNIQPIGEGQE